MAAREYSYTAELEEYQRQNPRSAARFAETQQVLAGGNSRLTAYFAQFPFYVERGEGCGIYDLDGNRRVDFYNNATSLILDTAIPRSLPQWCPRPPEARRLPILPGQRWNWRP